MTNLDTAGSPRRTAYRSLIACVFGAALAMPGQWAFGQVAAPGPAEEARWAVVQEYLEQRAAWSERTGIRVGVPAIGPGRDTQAEPAPDPTPAVDAAREIVAAGGARTVEAAVFLIDTSRERSMVGAAEMARMLERSAAEPRAGDGSPVSTSTGSAEPLSRFGEDTTWETLIAHVGPDWAVVQAFLDEREAFQSARRQVFLERDEAAMQAFLLQRRPSATAGVAAARAILDAGGHEKAVQAAEFLVDHAFETPDAQPHILAGVRWLVEHATDFDGWPRTLRAVDRARGVRITGGPGPLESFLEELAAGADDPELRAAARFYVASGLMQSANAALGPDDQVERRERALRMAAGLSAGVENVPFGNRDRLAPSPTSPGGEPSARTFAQAEADLLLRIRHATAGGTLPDLTGRRLDGVEEPLSAYRGRVVLIDFWATWCPPCIDALPELRELVADLPADRFALLAISLDEDLTTVLDFLETEPMPWDNWHAGVGSELERTLAARGVVPSYVLADEQGAILAHGFGPLPRFRCMAERAVAGEDPTCPPSEWMGVAFGR